MKLNPILNLTVEIENLFRLYGLSLEESGRLQKQFLQSLTTTKQILLS
jgi:hypothetical protein